VGHFRHEKATKLGSGNQALNGQPEGDQHGPVEATPTPPSIADDASVPAAWYPDPSDPGAMRYWDGTAWTEHTQMPPPPSTARVGEALDAPPDERVGSTSSEESPPKSPAREDALEVTLSGVTEPETARDADDNGWAKKAAEAVARARTADTPEAWGEAAQAAGVVTGMAQTMQMAADARLTAHRRTQVAERANDEAREAAQAATDARRTAEQRVREAQKAAGAAKEAARVADHAKQTAEQQARATPETARAAQMAGRAAVAAKRTAQEVEQIVAQARSANTPEAWSEARLRAIAALAVAAPKALPADETQH
jgi:hypothetical protein